MSNSEACVENPCISVDLRRFSTPLILESRLLLVGAVVPPGLVIDPSEGAAVLDSPQTFPGALGSMVDSAMLGLLLLCLPLPLHFGKASWYHAKWEECIGIFPLPVCEKASVATALGSGFQLM